MSKINIELCKVLYKDNKPYIAIVAECSETDHFTKCTITDYNFASGQWGEGVQYDITTALQETDPVTGKPIIGNKLTHLIPLGSIVGNPNDIYNIHLETDLGASADAVISDVRFVYDCLIDKLIHSTEDCCQPVSDDVIRMYLTLYGHTTAMQYGDIQTAKEMYTRLIKCGCKCPSVPKTSCGCER